MFKISALNAFRRDIKKLKGEVKESVKEAMEAIKNDPTIADPLNNNWKGFSSYHFRHNPEYRIIYTVYVCKIDNTCKYKDIEHSEEEMQNCTGLIEFTRFGTREEMNEIYQTNKKIVNTYRRE